MANPGISVGPNLSDESNDGDVQDSEWGGFSEYSDTNGASEGGPDALDVERGDGLTEKDVFAEAESPLDNEVEATNPSEDVINRARHFREGGKEQALKYLREEQTEQAVNLIMDDIYRETDLPKPGRTDTINNFEDVPQITPGDNSPSTPGNSTIIEEKHNGSDLDKRVPSMISPTNMKKEQRSQLIKAWVPEVGDDTQASAHEPAYTQGQTGGDVPAVDKDNETLAVPQTVEDPADVLVETPADTTQVAEAAQGAELAVEEAALPVLDSAGDTEARQLTSWKTPDTSKSLIKSLRKEGLTLLKISKEQKNLIDAIATSIEYRNYLDEIAECRKKTRDSMRNLLDAEGKASNGFLSKAGFRLGKRWTSWLGRRRERKVNRRYRTECAVAGIRGDISNGRDTLGGSMSPYAIMQRLEESHRSSREYNYGTKDNNFALSVMNGIETGSDDGPTSESKGLQTAREKKSSEGNSALSIKRGLEGKD